MQRIYYESGILEVFMINGKEYYDIYRWLDYDF